MTRTNTTGTLGPELWTTTGALGGGAFGSLIGESPRIENTGFSLLVYLTSDGRNVFCIGFNPSAAPLPLRPPPPKDARIPARPVWEFQVQSSGGSGPRTFLRLPPQSDRRI